MSVSSWEVQIALVRLSDRVEEEDIFGGPTIPPLAPGDRADTGFIRVAVAPDGTLIAGANLDGKICIWDTKKGDQVARFTSHGTKRSPSRRNHFRPCCSSSHWSNGQ